MGASDLDAFCDKTKYKLGYRQTTLFQFLLNISGKFSNDAFSSAMITAIYITGNAFLMTSYTSGPRHLYSMFSALQHGKYHRKKTE